MQSLGYPVATRIGAPLDEQPTVDTLQLDSQGFAVYRDNAIGCLFYRLLAAGRIQRNREDYDENKSFTQTCANFHRICERGFSYLPIDIGQLRGLYGGELPIRYLIAPRSRLFILSSE